MNAGERAQPEWRDPLLFDGLTERVALKVMDRREFRSGGVTVRYRPQGDWDDGVDQPGRRACTTFLQSAVKLA